MLGKLICWWKGAHVWGKPYSAHPQYAAQGLFDKRCKRCGEVRAVKRRSKGAV